MPLNTEVPAGGQTGEDSSTSDSGLGSTASLYHSAPALQFTFDQLALLNDAAIESAWRIYANAGLTIFPLQGKRPLTSHGLHDATADHEVIGAWLKRWPKANIGFAVPAGLAVVDVDDLDESERLERVHGRLESPLAVVTGRGVQLYYRASGIRNSAGQLAPGIDVRGEGGYSILPPSRHPSGRAYQWWSVMDDLPEVLEPLPMPPWMLTRLRGRPTAFPRRTDVSTDVRGDSSEIFGEGRRNDGLASVGGSLRRKGFDVAAIAAVLHAVNDRQCRPPLDADEVERIAASVGRYEPASTAPTPVNRPTPLFFGSNWKGA